MTVTWIHLQESRYSRNSASENNWKPRRKVEDEFWGERLRDPSSEEDWRRLMRKLRNWRNRKKAPAFMHSSTLAKIWFFPVHTTLKSPLRVTCPGAWKTQFLDSQFHTSRKGETYFQLGLLLVSPTFLFFLEMIYF